MRTVQTKELNVEMPENSARGRAANPSPTAHPAAVPENLPGVNGC